MNVAVGNESGAGSVVLEGKGEGTYRAAFSSWSEEDPGKCPQLKRKLASSFKSLFFTPDLFGKLLWRKPYLDHLCAIYLCSRVHCNSLLCQKLKTHYAGVIKNMCFRVVWLSQLISWKIGSKELGASCIQKRKPICLVKMISQIQDWYLIIKYKWLLLWKFPFWFLSVLHSGFNFFTINMVSKET